MMDGSLTSARAIATRWLLAAREPGWLVMRPIGQTDGFERRERPPTTVGHAAVDHGQLDLLDGQDAGKR